jgi:hypothetical protein
MKLISRACISFGLLLVLAPIEFALADNEVSAAKPQSRQIEAAESASSQGAVSAPALSQPLDLGPVMLRCTGADGVFSFGEASDDIVDWAGPIEPVDFSKGHGVTYRFETLPSEGDHCRIFHAPFPAGVEIPPLLDPDPPAP